VLMEISRNLDEARLALRTQKDRGASLGAFVKSWTIKENDISTRKTKKAGGEAPGSYFQDPEDGGTGTLAKGGIRLAEETSESTLGGTSQRRASPGANLRRSGQQELLDTRWNVVSMQRAHKWQPGKKKRKRLWRRGWEARST